MKNKTIESILIEYKAVDISFSDWLESLEKKYLVTEPVIPKIPDYVIIPDKAYVKKLINNLSLLKPHLSEIKFKNLDERLRKILSEDDFDDTEEIMEDVNEAIKKYVYGSDTEVSASDWKNFEIYLAEAGYIEVDIKAGDNVSGFKIYFERPIPTTGGKANTIKQIQLKPYTLKYYDEENEIQTLKLCGKCTYYK